MIKKGRGNMGKLKFKPTNKTVDFFNEFAVIDNLSIEIMLNRVLCLLIVREPMEAAIILVWYTILCIDNLDDRQKMEAVFSLISSLICCTIDDKNRVDEALEVLVQIYNKTVKNIDNNIRKSDDDISIPSKMRYGEEIKVKLVRPAMDIKKYSKEQEITIEEAIEKKIEEMCPYNPNKAEEIILNRFMYAVSAQDPIKVNTTIFMLSAMLIHFDEDSRTHFEQCIEMLKNQCMEKMETSYHYRRIKVLREKIYSK
jgi:hypothetical protein